MNKQELTALVAEILGQMEPGVKATAPAPLPPAPEAEAVPDITAMNLRELYLTEHPADPERFRAMKKKTPARLGAGKAGPRYKTLTMLRFRADHAAAQDAVFSQVPEDFAKENGLLPVQTRNIETGQAIFVRYCRVGAGDAIGDLTGCELVCMLVGERPGLVTDKSMSVYLTYHPHTGVSESSRTVVSNIHAQGTPAVEAGAHVAELIETILRKKVSGVGLHWEAEG